MIIGILCDCEIEGSSLALDGGGHVCMGCAGR